MVNMNRVIVFFAAIALLSMNLACSDGGLLTAPDSSPLLVIDFEDNSLYKTFFNDPYDWSSAGTVYNGITTDENHTRGGYNSYKISADKINHYDDANINNNLGIESKPGVFPVNTGTTYLLSFWIKTENIVAGTWGIGARASVIVNDEAGREIWLPSAGGTSDWTKMYTYYTAEEGDRELFFRFALNGSGTVWFDDIRVEEFEPEWSSLYFIDFEDSSYSAYFNAPYNYSPSFTSSALVSDENHTPEGARSLKVSAFTINPEGLNNAGIQSKPGAFSVEAGKIYRISFWVKTEDVVGAQSGGMGARPFIIAEDGSPNGREIWSPNTVGTNDWKKMTYVYTAEPDDTEIIISLILFGSGTVWYDDVRIERI